MERSRINPILEEIPATCNHRTVHTHLEKQGTFWEDSAIQMGPRKKKKRKKNVEFCSGLGKIQKQIMVDQRSPGFDCSTAFSWQAPIIRSLGANYSRATRARRQELELSFFQCQRKLFDIVFFQF